MCDVAVTMLFLMWPGTSDPIKGLTLIGRAVETDLPERGEHGNATQLIGSGVPVLFHLN